jgi:hypothetical protein
MVKMKDIEFEGENFNLDFEINQLRDGIHWEELNYPNEQVKQTVLEIVYYAEIENMIKELLKEIEASYTGYELNKLGTKAIKIIGEIKPVFFLKNHNFFIIDTINSIRYTLNREVRILNETKLSSSKARKQEVLNDARNHLIKDITLFLNRINQYSVVKSNK